MATVPQAWAVLELALVERRVVRLRYHGHDRVVCPHVLGWKSGRAMCLCYHVGGTTSEGTLRADPRERWRSMFVDQVEEAVLTGDAWQSGEDYIAITLELCRRSGRRCRQRRRRRPLGGRAHQTC